MISYPRQDQCRENVDVKFVELHSLMPSVPVRLQCHPLALRYASEKARSTHIW